MNNLPLGMSNDGNNTDHRLSVKAVDDERGILQVVILGSTVEESKTQADAASNVITFAANIDGVEIYHAEDTGQEFVVNGLTLAVPAGGWRALIGGTPGKTVTIPANVDCTVARMS